ncbi:glycosyltransferase family 39 protein [Streptomyces sp. DW26H14]|uniref:glycosyltransferase family 39 protein n=1 Tax=Streptomyces sp. DW26H14 TaxID=3435395 RepID=UPI00403DBD49
MTVSDVPAGSGGVTPEVRGDAAEPAGGAAPFDRRVYIVAGLVLVVLMALSTRYGFQRDELYFLDSGRHLQAGYVDQPVLAPLLARLSLSLFGVSMAGLRLWAALAAAATVVVGALTAREFGGARRAQLLAAVGTGTMPVLLSSGHVANTTSYEILAWAAIALVVARIGRTGDPRWWVAVGVLAGVGAEFNHLAGIFAVVLLAVVLLGPARALAANRWVLAGAVIAVVLVLPDLWWQAHHGWAMFAMTHALNRENGGPGNIVTWSVGQLGMSCLAMIVVWAAGLRFLWRSGNALWRSLAWVYGVLFVVFAVTSGAQTYYLAGLYVCLLGAGAVGIDEWLYAERPRRYRLLTATGLTAALSAVVVLPVLPPSDVGWTYGISATSGETIGWPQLVTTVDGAWKALPARQRADAVIFTADYSEAGAVNELGRGYGLPTAVSEQNTDWWWGPGDPDATTVLAVAPGPAHVPAFAASLRQHFAHVRTVATLSNPYGVPNIEQGGHVYVCTGPHGSWGTIWKGLRTYE